MRVRVWADEHARQFSEMELHEALTPPVYSNDLLGAIEEKLDRTQDILMKLIEHLVEQKVVSLSEAQVMCVNFDEIKEVEE